jgi:hypothetical protein
MGIFDIVSDVVRTGIAVVEVPLSIVEPVTRTIREGAEEVSDSVKELLDI